MLSIALFSECYHPMRNGVVVSVSSFAHMLKLMGHTVTIFTAHHPQQLPEINEGVYRFLSVPVPSRARYPLPLPIASAEVWSALEELPFDIVHANSPMVLGHVARAMTQRRNLPFIFTYHTLIEEYGHYLPLPQGLTRRWAVRVSREFSNSADHIIAPSEHVAERLRFYRVTKPISVIPTGIDIDLIDAVPPADIRARFAIPAAAPLLLYAGRLAREKNLPRLMSMLRIVLSEEPDTHMLLVGGGPFEEEIHTLCAESHLGSRVHMAGFLPREQVFQCMRAADVFVFASLTETQGLVVGEAMACGTPVVAVEAEAECEVITSGVDGLLVPNADEPFAEAVLTLLRDRALHDAMGHRARLRAENLSARLRTEQLLEVYQEVVDNYTPHAGEHHFWAQDK